MSVFQINIILYLQIIVLFSNYNIFPRNRSILILTCEKNWKASQWKKKNVCVKVKNTEKSGRETTFVPVKKLPKGAKNWIHVQFCFLREK